MIYTVTFNPAIDYVMSIDSIKIGDINRAVSEEIYFGGKGINVSLVLKELGINSSALGFAAGFTGEAIQNGVRSLGVSTDFVQLANGNSRINVKIKSSDETALNGQGPHIDDESVNKLFEKLDKLKNGDYIVLAGSIPNSLPQNIYEKILKRLSGRGISFVVDATGDLLLNVLKYKPFLIKPNNFELEQLFKTQISSTDDIVFYAKKLQTLGASNVLVSCAAHGAVLVDKYSMVHIIDAPKGRLVNSVGAGDSMVAGFLAGYIQKEDFDYALRLGIASGSATAFSYGLAKREKIYELFNQIQF